MNNWKRDEKLELENNIPIIFVKRSSPIIRMSVYNKGIGWMWSIEMFGNRTSRKLFTEKIECMENCEKEAMALMKTAFQELWNISL